MKSRLLIFSLFIFFAYAACKHSKEKPLDMSRVIAWCIVPFDSMHRTPEQRIQMLKELGIQRYAYDWRDKHLPEMMHEWALAKENKIQIDGVWLWLDARTDTLGKLSPFNELLFHYLDSAQLKTSLWLSFNNNYFEGLDDSLKLNKAIRIVGYLADRLKPLGCNLMLYNHGDWFGLPPNQVNIINALPGKEIGMVYSFHHVHAQIDRFHGLVDTMLPYLKVVNLNGMRKEGPQILPLNSGDQEQSMIRYLIDKGYRGPWGILGHVDTADVKTILSQNLTGLEKILNTISY
ncbi:MAG: AP endonuclease [Saprospiraceae bacterium]